MRNRSLKCNFRYALKAAEVLWLGANFGLFALYQKPLSNSCADWKLANVDGKNERRPKVWPPYFRCTVVVRSADSKTGLNKKETVD